MTLFVWPAPGGSANHFGTTLVKNMKKTVSETKDKVHNGLYKSLGTKGGERSIYKLAKDRERKTRDLEQNYRRFRELEMKKTLKMMKNDKAIGLDNILTKVWKVLREQCISLFNEIMRS
ncbi:hypothetical protein Lal_00018584 [Lupinus albus]|nr:hypothetical protein Lal_00018584 [Lupinus albus]